MRWILRWIFFKKCGEMRWNIYFHRIHRNHRISYKNSPHSPHFLQKFTQKPRPGHQWKRKVLFVDLNCCYRGLCIWIARKCIGNVFIWINWSCFTELFSNRRNSRISVKRNLLDEFQIRNSLTQSQLERKLSSPNLFNLVGAQES